MTSKKPRRARGGVRVSQLSLNAISHSQRPQCSPVTYQLSPRSDLCHLLACHLSPLSAQRRASGYQNRVHKNHAYLITCPHGPISRRFLSDRLRTWGNASRPRRSRGWSSARNIGGSAQPRRMPARERAALKSICRNGEGGPGCGKGFPPEGVRDGFSHERSCLG